MDDGSVDEITDADAEITWTVHLVNKKAAHPDRGNSETAANLTIDPGNRTLNGPNQRQVCDTGQISFASAPVTTVPLGEIRSDSDNHLIVLGGFGKSASPLGSGITGFWGNDDWYDDVSDGPVTATVKLRSDNSTPPVVGAWVMVGPPKYAPHQQSVITLYDRLLQTMIGGGLVTPRPPRLTRMTFFQFCNGPATPSGSRMFLGAHLAGSNYKRSSSQCNLQPVGSTRRWRRRHAATQRLRHRRQSVDAYAVRTHATLAR